MGVEYLIPTSDLLEQIAFDMRREDAIEVWASHRQTPLQALKMGVQQSDYATVVVIDGTPCAILGLCVRDILTGAGIPWLLGTNAALRYKRQFLELSPPVIDDMLSLCPRLYNYVHCDNRASIRWLKWLGFEFDAAEPYGPAGELFYRFHKERVH